MSSTPSLERQWPVRRRLRYARWRSGRLAGGFENIFRTLQALPGVTSTDELGSRIAVRGGGPDQNLTSWTASRSITLFDSSFRPKIWRRSDWPAFSTRTPSKL